MNFHESDELLPHPDGIVKPLLDADLRAKRDEEGPKPTAAGTRARISQALACSRQVGFQILGVPELTPVPAEVLMGFDVGNALHARLQMLMQRDWGAQIEVLADYSPISTTAERGVSLSGSADAVYDGQRAFHAPVIGEGVIFQQAVAEGERVCVEIKSISGFGFMVATGQTKRTDERPGPKPEHVAQAALYANAPQIDAQIIHMIYVDKDKHSIAEWLLDMDEPLAKLGDITPRELALAEITRLQGILGRIDGAHLPARHIPGYGTVDVPPPAGSARGSKPWNCMYCRYQPVCAELQTGPVPIEQLDVALADMGVAWPTD